MNDHKKVLLVYPEFPDTYWSFRYALSFEGKRSTFPPLGLMTVSAMLPNTWERRLVDMNVQPLRSSDIEWADMVFTSAMIVQKESLRGVVALSKALGKRLVVGGPYITTSPTSVPEADHIFVGEAEDTLPEFVHDLQRGDARRIYQAAERPVLFATPVPDFQLADLKRYWAMSLQYSRGCPFNCEFCDIIEMYGRVPRTKSHEQMLAELDALTRLAGAGGCLSLTTISSATSATLSVFSPNWSSGLSAIIIHFRSSPKRASTLLTTMICSMTCGAPASAASF